MSWLKQNSTYKHENSENETTAFTWKAFTELEPTDERQTCGLKLSVSVKATKLSKLALFKCIQ
jgi:hypothetical protein